MIKGALLGLLICAIIGGIAYVVISYPVILLVPAAVFVYCCALIGKEGKW